MNQSQRNKYLEIFGFLLFLILHLFFNHLFPLWQGPDEPTHFEYVYSIYQQDTLEKAQRNDQAENQRLILQSMYDQHCWVYMGNFSPVSKEHFVGHWTQINNSPPLYYYFTAKLLSWITKTQEPERILLYSRYINTALAAFTFLLAMFLLKKILSVNDRHLYPYLLFSFVLHPQFLFIGSMLNNDNLAIPIHFLFLIMIYSYWKNPKPHKILLMTAIVFIGIFTKRNLYYSGVMLIGTIMARHINFKEIRNYKKHILWILGSLIPIGILFTTFSSLAGRELNEMRQSFGTVVKLSTYSLEHIYQFSYMLSSSFIFKGGWLTIEYPHMINLLIMLLFFTGIYFYFRYSKGPEKKLTATFIAIFLCMVFASDFFNPARSPQGRYIFPILPLVHLALLKGFTARFPEWKDRILRSWILIWPTLFFFALIMICYYYYSQAKIYI